MSDLTLSGEVRVAAAPLRQQLVLRGGLFVLCGVILLTCSIMSGNDGTFIYTLDDPYIHLALARRIWEGHYGINLVEHASPSSSALWPFLLAPFSQRAIAWYAPLVLNTLFTLGTVIIIADVVARSIQGTPLSRGFATITLLLLVMATNPFGLVFSGMEHSLQVTCACLVARGMLFESKEGRFSALTWLGLVLGPLVRYESLALCGAAVLMLIFLRRYAAALRVALASSAPLASFTGFLLMIGLEPLPNSIAAKSHLSEFGALLGMWRQMTEQLEFDNRGPIVGLCGALFAAIALLSRAEWLRRVAMASTAAVVAHLFLGRSGWLNRYEVYICAYSLLVLAGLALSKFASKVERENRIAVVLTLGAVLLLFPYFYMYRSVPIASHNIYAQQYQMRRFVQSYAGPVAVNDLGLVAYDNPNYVLDLWGLASNEALHARLDARNNGGSTAVWMEHIARTKGAEIVMIYDIWFDDSIPESWMKLGELHYERELLSSDQPVVSFYALQDFAKERATKHLEELSVDLPEGANFEFEAR